MKIGVVLKDYRCINRIGIRELAKEIGISIATLSRIETGADFDIGSFKKLWNWLLSEET